jgi:hypothetical protein
MRAGLAVILRQRENSALPIKSMRNYFQSGAEPVDDYAVPMILVRIVLTLVCGSLLVLGWRLLIQDRPRPRIPLGRRVLLNVEDAVRWRPEF